MTVHKPCSPRCDPKYVKSCAGCRIPPGAWDDEWENGLTELELAMWRLLVQGERARGCGLEASGHCIDCAVDPDVEAHASDCEWLRIARAIGYRP